MVLVISACFATCEFWKGLTKIREIMYFENEDCRIKESVENGESTMGECKEMNCREREWR